MINLSNCPFLLLCQGPLGEVLDTRQLVSDVSGAGNNWAHGHHEYGPRYREVRLGRGAVGLRLAVGWAVGWAGWPPRPTGRGPTWGQLLHLCASPGCVGVVGPSTTQAILEKVRLTTEECDSLQVRHGGQRGGRAMIPFARV
jgi:hypothetical protein